MNNFSDIIKNAGIVGAGGAGFPTHIKMVKADTIIINGAECEPLLCKDKELMQLYPEKIIGGLLIAIKNTNANLGIIALKSKNKIAIEKFNNIINSHKLNEFIKLHILGDYYPSGDEIILINEVLGKTVPFGKIPITIGVIVSNVETFYNIYEAFENSTPVTDKFLTIAGEIENPVTLKVPIGTKLKDLIPYTGKILVNDPAILIGGIMMSDTTFDFNTVVSKTTSGYVILSKEHEFIKLKTQNINITKKIGKSACDQCSYCTELCPRYLIGHPIEPHKVMRSLLMSNQDEPLINKFASGCVECGLCGFYSCPEGLLPNKICSLVKKNIYQNSLKFEFSNETKIHPMSSFRKVSTKRLMSKLNILKYDKYAKFKNIEIKPKEVTIKLKQHIGNTSIPIVKEGENVKKGQLIATIPDNKLGANIHASIDGKIKLINSTEIIIEAS